MAGMHAALAAETEAEAAESKSIIISNLICRRAKLLQSKEWNAAAAVASSSSLVSE